MLMESFQRHYGPRLPNADEAVSQFRGVQGWTTITIPRPGMRGMSPYPWRLTYLHDVFP